MSKLPLSTVHKTMHFMTRTIWGFIILGVIAFIIGVTIAFLVGRSSEPLAYQENVIVVEATPTTYRMQVPTPLSATEVPTPTQTPEPTPRPNGATETVVEGDNYWVLVKRVCRVLGYEIWDYDPMAAKLVEMNQEHNRQYVGNTLQPSEKVGIGCILYE
jgi:hypothetical protein